MHGSKVTLASVADRAGVSLATASKALSGRPDVSDKTREKIIRIANEIGFRPNRLAQNLALGRSGAVGLITHDMEGRFSIPIMLGAEDRFGEGEVSILLCDARGDTIREQYHIRNLLSRQVDGLIIVGARPDPRPSIGDVPVPVVYAYAPSMNDEDVSVIVDNEHAGRLVAQHLLECQRTRIAMISGDYTYGAAQDRARGVISVLDAAGLKPVGDQPLYGPWSESWGRQATRLFLDQHGESQIDAFVCGSDQIARGCLDILHDRGVRVPEDIAVIGHDNWHLIAEASRPPLTTIDQNLHDLGQTAAQLLIDAMSGREMSSQVIQGKLVLRSSTL
ncbi:LacI family DNA-binding transcriptional regulator [Trueperella sp. LYQ143]|uniref:LacI family DNA-binding transcriptional regulator n=1 Tax=unclassified Trueperella TaxID=2630174 RepID=UPI003983CB13